MVFDTKNFLYYFRLSPDRTRMLFGGRPKSMRASHAEKAESLRSEMVEVFPQLAGFKIEYAWFGNCGFTFDRFPHIGQHDGVYHAMGYCGHGVAMATYLGEQMAALITGKGGDTTFAENSFFTVPFYRGNPWFSPLAHFYFAVQDRTQLELPGGATLLNLCLMEKLNG
jgi:glycine/D-amino acid oxidase-like deaminating enzyme